MPSLIARQPKDTRKQTTVSLSGTVLADLELYCQFIDSARDWVINEALKSIFQKDKAFLDWKQQRRSAPNAVTSIPSSGSSSGTDTIHSENQRTVVKLPTASGTKV
jgi:hypothetical protein